MGALQRGSVLGRGGGRERGGNKEECGRLGWKGGSGDEGAGDEVTRMVGRGRDRGARWGRVRLALPIPQTFFLGQALSPWSGDSHFLQRCRRPPGHGRVVQLPRLNEKQVCCSVGTLALLMRSVEEEEDVNGENRR